MDQKPEWAIKIKRTITLTKVRSSRGYFDHDSDSNMTLEQALAFERGLDKQDKIESFMEDLEFSTDDEIELTEEISEG